MYLPLYKLNWINLLSAISTLIHFLYFAKSLLLDCANVPRTKLRTAKILFVLSNILANLILCSKELLHLKVIPV